MLELWIVAVVRWEKCGLLMKQTERRTDRHIDSETGRLIDILIETASERNRKGENEADNETNEPKEKSICRQRTRKIQKQIKSER